MRRRSRLLLYQGLHPDQATQQYKNVFVEHQANTQQTLLLLLTKPGLPSLIIRESVMQQNCEQVMPYPEREVKMTSGRRQRRGGREQNAPVWDASSQHLTGPQYISTRVDPQECAYE